MPRRPKKTLTTRIEDFFNTTPADLKRGGKGTAQAWPDGRSAAQFIRDLYAAARLWGASKVVGEEETR